MTRTIVIEGTEEWVGTTLARSYLQPRSENPDVPFNELYIGNCGSLKETRRVTEILEDE